MFRMKDTGAEHTEITEAVIAAAIKVQGALGPGLFESVYEVCLAHELRLRGVEVETQVPISVEYEGLHLPNAYRMDMVAGKSVIVEIKAVDRINPVHVTQLKSYLKLSRMRVGLLLNLWAWPLRQGGIKRIVNSNG